MGDNVAFVVAFGDVPREDGCKAVAQLLVSAIKWGGLWAGVARIETASVTPRDLSRTGMGHAAGPSVCKIYTVSSQSNKLLML